jgi:acyl carrier protein
MDVEGRVRQIIADRLKVDPSEVKPESSLIEDLRADSLDIVEMVMRLEETFDIQIPDQEIGGLDTVGKVVEYIEKKLKEKA